MCNIICNVIPDRGEDETRRLNRHVKIDHSRKHVDEELEIEVC